MKKSLFAVVVAISLFSCGKSEEEQQPNSYMKALDKMMDQQVESGIGERYNNLEEAGQAMDNQQRIQQEAEQYQKVRCSSCGGRGQYYNASGQLMTCPTCGGLGYVHKYNNY